MISIMKAFNSTGVSRRGEWKNASGEEQHPGCLARAWVDDVFKAHLLMLKAKCDFSDSFPEYRFISNYVVDNTNDRPSDLTDFSLYLYRSLLL